MKLSLINIRRERETLFITYEVMNDSEEMIFLADAVLDRFGVLETSREAPTDELAQLCHGGDERLFVLVGNAPDPRPPGHDYHEVYRPYLSKLDPGDTKETTIRCALPLVEWSLYEPPDRAETGIVLREISRIHLAVDYLSEGKWLCAPVEDQGFPGVFLGSGLFRRAHAERRVSDLKLVLMVRENFPRFADDREGTT